MAKLTTTEILKAVNSFKALKARAPMDYIFTFVKNIGHIQSLIVSFCEEVFRTKNNLARGK